MCVWGGGGLLTYKMGMYVPCNVKKKGTYRADQTEKVGAALKEWLKLYI